MIRHFCVGQLLNLLNRGEEEEGAVQDCSCRQEGWLAGVRCSMEGRNFSFDHLLEEVEEEEEEGAGLQLQPAGWQAGRLACLLR